jgi:hypothetical protein
MPEIHLEKLVYFAISIFWRGTLQWSAVAGGDIPRLSMSYRHKEALRHFLLGRKSLPSDVVLTIAIWPFKKVHPFIIPPMQDLSAKHKSMSAIRKLGGRTFSFWIARHSRVTHHSALSPAPTSSASDIHTACIWA